jgi:hypothetical protein
VNWKIETGTGKRWNETTENKTVCQVVSEFFPVSSSYRQLSSGITAFFKATHTSILTYILFFLNFLAVFVLL